MKFSPNWDSSHAVQAGQPLLRPPCSLYGPISPIPCLCHVTPLLQTSKASLGSTSPVKCGSLWIHQVHSLFSTATQCLHSISPIPCLPTPSSPGLAGIILRKHHPIIPFSTSSRPGPLSGPVWMTRTVSELVSLSPSLLPLTHPPLQASQ